MRRTIQFIGIVLALASCNKSDNTPPPTVQPGPGTPNTPPDPAGTCAKLTGSLPGWTTNGFWLDDVLQFEPQQVVVKDTAGYWLITACADVDHCVYLSFKQAPGKSWMYYRAHGYPTHASDDSCAMHVAYNNGQQLVWHPLYSPDNWNSDMVPVHVTSDSIYVSFEYNAGASSGGGPRKIAGRVKGKRT